MLELALSSEAADLLLEAESRWHLVEEAWSAKSDGTPLIVLYDAPREVLVPALTGRRRSITEVRPALNGYQKGHCFYCFKPIGLSAGSVSADVDHFLPHSLMARGFPHNLDSPWNLVLACPTCNRGNAGKFASVPHNRYLARLHKRNEFLIGSNHPLRETLIFTTGADRRTRLHFLQSAMDTAISISPAKIGWSATDEQVALF